MATYTKVWLAEQENRKRIDEMIGHDSFMEIADHEGGSVWTQDTRHDLWLKWHEELWNRLNWMTHLNWSLGMIRGGIAVDVKLTLEDYVYNK